MKATLFGYLLQAAQTHTARPRAANLRLLDRRQILHSNAKLTDDEERTNDVRTGTCG